MKKLVLTLAFAGVALASTACHIGAGFDTAEKRRAMAWQEETPKQVAAPEQLPHSAKQGAPIVYLLVAG